MYSGEKAIELVERAKDFGLHVEFDSGLVIVERMATDESGEAARRHRGIGENITRIRHLLQLRAIGARGKEFVGQRVWFPDYGKATLANANSDGSLGVSIKNLASGRPQSFSASAENLVIVVDAASAPAAEGQTSEIPRNRILGLI
jgi:hypothetical protein